MNRGKRLLAGLLALVLFVSFMRGSQSSSPSQPTAANVLPQPSATPTPTPRPSYTPIPAPTPDPRPIEEIMAEEIQELQEEEAAQSEQGAEAPEAPEGPTVSVSGEAVIEIGETEAAGGM